MSMFTASNAVFVPSRAARAPHAVLAPPDEAAPDVAGAIVESKKATFIEEKTLTFTIANTGGLAIITAAGLLGTKVNGLLVVEVALVLGVLVTAIGTPWVKPGTESPVGAERIRAVLNTVVVGAFNTALLAVALWGSLSAIQLAVR